MHKFLRIFFLLILPLSIFCQSKNVAGSWTGYLYQDHKSQSYTISMELTQTANTLSGTIKGVLPTGKYYLFKVDGSISGDSLYLSDASVVDENVSYGTERLCIKRYAGKLNVTGNKTVVEGRWANIGNRSYANGRYYDGNFTCFPGVFIIEKTEAAKPDPTASATQASPEGTFQNRKIEVQKSLEIFSDSLKLVFYDNGIVDDDTITVFLNKEPIISKQRLTANPLAVSIKLKPGIDNEIIMFAENMGSIPPNTALLIFTDNGQRYEVTIDSDKGKNGTIILRRKTP
jgi:hypothetical protein